MTDKRRETIVAWATETQGLSPDVIDLTESTEAILTVMDLARNTTRNVDLAFETEPSTFVKVLHELAPRRNRKNTGG